MRDGVQFAVDAGTVAFKKDAPGISVDGEEVTFDWSKVERVRVDDVPWADAFDSKEFYKLPATVAKPVKQVYRFGSDVATLMKPREELKKAAWSLHNAPWTLNHPSNGMVKDVDDIRGFWRDPRYIDSLDDLDADLYIPVADDEAKQFVESNGDVSVGFYNRMVAVDRYDGVVGGEDDRDGVQGYQTNLYFDHVASVRMGRCSSEAGCGLHDSNTDGEYINVPCITNMNEDNDVPTGAKETKNNKTMTDDITQGQDCPGDGGIDIGVDSFSFEYLYAENDAVKAHVDELSERVSELEGELESAQDAKTVAEEQNEKLQARVDEFEADEKQELVAQILDHTERLGTEEELMALELDSLRAKHELVTELSTTEKTVDSTDEDVTPTFENTILRASPWDKEN